MPAAREERTVQSGVNGQPGPPRNSQGNPLGVVVQVLAILVLLAILGSVLLVLFAVASLTNAPRELAGGIGSQVGAAATQVVSAAVGVDQAVQNATDPHHPPSGLTYDTEFSSLLVWRAGEQLPGGGRYVLTLQSIERWQNASSVDTTLYGVVHAELRQPNEVTVLGQVLRSDRDAHDYAVYKGETFRISGTLYRANWLSQQSGSMAAGIYRNPDMVTAPLKFDYD